jgi:hypothetical protein
VRFCSCSCRQRRSKNTARRYRQERLEQRSESWTETQFIALSFEQFAGSCSGLHGISQIGQPQKPDGMIEVRFASNLKRRPPRIRKPAVLLGQTFRQKRIANRPGKRNVDDPASMDVSNFCPSKTEFSAAKTMRVNRDVPPRGNFFFEPLEMVHFSLGTSSLFFRCLFMAWRLPGIAPDCSRSSRLSADSAPTTMSTPFVEVRCLWSANSRAQTVGE